MSNKPKELAWGETPWDGKTRDELLREVQRMYSAISSLNSALSMSRGFGTGGYWGNDGTGGIALEKARQVIDPIHAEFDDEDVYRSFFRYATDLLFDCTEYRIGSGWCVCNVCGTMLGETRSPDGKRTTSCGQPCRYGDENCPGTFRKLEWFDLDPKHATVD